MIKVEEAGKIMFTSIDFSSLIEEKYLYYETSIAQDCDSGRLLCC